MFNVFDIMDCYRWYWALFLVFLKKFYNIKIKLRIPFVGASRFVELKRTEIKTSHFQLLETKQPIFTIQ